MPFRYSFWRNFYGFGTWETSTDTYCVSDTSLSNYGSCNDVRIGKVRFVQSDTATYPVGSLPCERDGTCIRYTSMIHPRMLDVIINLSYVGKQVILYKFRSITHSNFFTSPREYSQGIITVTADGTDIMYSPILKTNVYYIGSEYDPVNNVWIKINRYIPSGCTSYNLSCSVVDVWWSGQILCNELYSLMFENYINNIWYAGNIEVVYWYESSPILIMPLDYDEYLMYPELRKTVAYAANGVDQPGWNADNILRVVKELFPDRPWLVYDDSTYTLYSNGLDIDDVLELGKYVDVVNEALEIRVLNDKIPKDKVRQFIDFYRRQYTTSQPQ